MGLVGVGLATVARVGAQQRPGIVAPPECLTLEGFTKAKVGAFPKGADERDADTNDSALAVYFLVPYSRITGPKAVKCVWSEKVPVGTRLNSNDGLTQVVVLRSGHPGHDQWVEEQVNALADYATFFDESDAIKPAGIAVLTDSDDTTSSAQGDYARVRACRH